MSKPLDYNIGIDSTNPKDALGASKPDLSLVPPASIIHEALAMENGAKKYGSYNWRSKKVRAMVYIGAALRHLLAYMDGEDRASDSGVHHLAHAKACMGIALDAIETGNLIDDRPVKGAASRLLESRDSGRTVPIYEKAKNWPKAIKKPQCGRYDCTIAEHWEVE